MISVSCCVSAKTWKIIGEGIEIWDLATCCEGTLFDVESIIWVFSKALTTSKRQCLIDSIVVTNDYFSILVSVLLDLQLWVFFGVTILSVQFQLQLQFAQMRKLHVSFVAVVEVHFDFAQYLIHSKLSFEFAVGFVMYLQLNFYLVLQMFDFD